MVSTSSPSKFIMSDADLPFTGRVKLRENILAWISRDIGLAQFFFPPNHTTSLSSLEKNSYILSVMQNYLGSTSAIPELSTSPTAASAQTRCLMRENVAHLRRCVLTLRRGEATHRDVARYAMLLENFWDDANVALNDSSWAMCSLKFDTSQVSLRLVYLWLYMKQEFPPDEHPIGVRRAVYASLVNAFFKDKAPIDVPDYDKHSTNFKCLILAWYNELITGCQDLDTKLDDLAASNSMNMAADFIDTFLRVVQPDDDWMLRAQTLSNAWDEGKISQRSGAKRAKRTAKDDDGIAFATNEEMEDYFANDGVEEDDEDEDEDNDEDEDDLDPNNPATNGNTLYIGKPRRRKNVDEDYDPEEGATDDEEDDERSSDSRNDGGYRAPRQKAIQTPKRRGQVGRPPTKTRGRGRPPLARSSSRHAVKLEPTNQDEAPRRGPGRPPKSRTVYYRPTGRQNGFDDDDDDDDDDDGNEIQRQYDDEEDTLEDEIESKPPPRKKGRSGPRGRGRGRRDEYDDDVGGASYQSLQRRRGYQVGRR